MGIISLLRNGVTSAQAFTTHCPKHEDHYPRRHRATSNATTTIPTTAPCNSSNSSKSGSSSSGSSSSAVLLRRPQQSNILIHHQNSISTPKPFTGNDSRSNDEEEDTDVDEPSTAADVLRLLDCLPFPVDAATYADLLKECTYSLDLASGIIIHDHIRRKRLRGQGVLLVANRLLLMYVSCGRSDCARDLFVKMPVRDGISWATMIAGQSDNCEHSNALHLFVEMVKSEVWSLSGSSRVICVAAALQSCAETRDLMLGQCIHGLVMKIGGCCDDGWWKLVKSLIQFYGAMDLVESARMVFEDSSICNSSIFVTMANLYYRLHLYKEVLEIFQEMRRAGKWSIKSFFVSIVLKACGRMADGDRHGRQAHAIVIKTRLESDELLQCSLVEMYGRLGFVDDARKAFDGIGTAKVAACWEVMLEAYTQNDCFSEAVRLLYEMKAAGVEPKECMLNEVRLVC